ncbi:MAG: hypothetical protein MUP64_09105 [Anaerolineae bacterium]|nr:hypothetical protein [Anaerolineae bacterium]
MTYTRGYFAAVARAAGIPELWVDDCVQEMLLRVWREEEAKGFCKCVSVVARHAAIDFIRAHLCPLGQRSSRLRGVASDAPPPTSVEELVDVGHDPPGRRFEQELVELMDLEVALRARLSSFQRRCLLLYGRGWTAPEIALQEATTVGNVQASIHRGRVVLRAARQRELVSVVTG